MIRRAYLPGLTGAEWSTRRQRALEDVGLEPADVLGKYPHQLSGGQLQRLLIARALILDIEILVADEIISMLDASTRIDVLNILGDLKERGLGVLFVTHDLALGNYISDRVVILRHGRIVEMGRPRRSSRTRPSVHADAPDLRAAAHLEVGGDAAEPRRRSPEDE